MPTSEKIIRDPVHDVIAFRVHEPTDALLLKLINAREFQRLRRVRQLGLASLAYPGADHSRYSHSLGVMETARRMLEQLAHDVKIDVASKTICIVAALLHDLGHGPLSHVFERVSGIEHERLTQRVILDPESEVHRILFQHDKLMPELVVDFLRCKPRRTFYCDIIASQLDADRFDYLLRDNLMTGSNYGGYDLQWLLHALTVDEPSDRLAVTFKGVSAIEAYLQSRFNMYRNVYFHKVVRSAEGMVRLALQRAKRLAIQGRLETQPEVQKALIGQRLTMQEFTDLDDVSVLSSVKQWSRADDTVLASLCRGVLERKLFKTIDVSHLNAAVMSEAELVANQVVASAGGDVGYDLFIDQPTSTSYETYDPDQSAAGVEILVKDEIGKLQPFAAISPLAQMLDRQLMFRRIHVATEYRDAVKRSLHPFN